MELSMVSELTICIFKHFFTDFQLSLLAPIPTSVALSLIFQVYELFDVMMVSNFSRKSIWEQNQDIL